MKQERWSFKHIKCFTHSDDSQTDFDFGRTMITPKQKILMLK